MKRLILSAFVGIGLLGGGTCQVVSAQVQGDTRYRSDYTDQGTRRGGNWGLLGLCGLFGLLGARRSRTYESNRRIEGAWEPRPTH